MPQKIIPNVIAPGFGKSETVTEHINILLDFAQFYDFPDYHLLVQKLATIEQHYGNTICTDLDEETYNFFLDMQYNIITYADDKLHNDTRFINKVAAMSNRIDSDPESAYNKAKSRNLDEIYNAFQEMFSEELKDYPWYHRIVEKIIWKFDSWFGNSVIRIYPPFMGDMVGHTKYWRMSYEISMTKAFIWKMCSRKAVP